MGATQLCKDPWIKIGVSNKTGPFSVWPNPFSRTPMGMRKDEGLSNVRALCIQRQEGAACLRGCELGEAGILQLRSREVAGQKLAGLGLGLRLGLSLSRLRCLRLRERGRKLGGLCKGWAEGVGLIEGWLVSGSLLLLNWQRGGLRQTSMHECLPTPKD